MVGQKLIEKYQSSIMNGALNGLVNGLGQLNQAVPYLYLAGRRFAHRCIAALEDAGFSFKDMFAWMRQRAPHRAQRISIVYERRGDIETSRQWGGWRVGNLRPTFEPVLWFTKPYKIGTTIADNVLSHGVGAFNEEAFLKYEDQPDNVLNSGFMPGETGHHPTQKPVKLMQALIELTTQKEQIVLDPFCGSGTTLVAAKNTGRNYIGFEVNKEYVRIAEGRLFENNKIITNERTTSINIPLLF